MLQPGLVFQQHLPHALQQHALFPQGLQQDLPENVEKVGDLVLHGLAHDPQIAHRAPAFPMGGQHHVRAHAAGLGGHVRAELRKVPPGRPGLSQAAGKERRQRLQIVRQGIQRQQQAHIGDALRGQLMAEERVAGRQAPTGAGQGSIARRHVRHMQIGDGGQGFRAVGGLLRRLQPGRLLGQTLPGRSVASLLRGPQPGGFGIQPGLFQPVIRQQHHGGAVRVVEEMGADGLLEELLAGGKALLDGGKRRFPGQRGQRIAVIEPGGERLDHGRQTTREAAGIVFAVGEFHTVDGGLHGGGGDALFHQAGQGLENEQFGFGHLARVDALEARGVVHLPQVRLQTAARGVLAQPGGDERPAAEANRAVLRGYARASP